MDDTQSSSKDENPRLRRKGRFISAKQLNALKARSANAKKRKKPNNEEVPTEKSKSESYERCPVEGYRIVQIKKLADQMKCNFCQENLSFDAVENEERHGLASVFTIRCSKCLFLSKVETGEKYETPNRNQVYEINSKAVLGTLNSGKRHSHLSKLLSVMNVPSMSSSTFKRHEKYLIPTIHEAKKDSLEKTAQEEQNNV